MALLSPCSANGSIKAHRRRAVSSSNPRFGKLALARSPHRPSSALVRNHPSANHAGDCARFTAKLGWKNGPVHAPARQRLIRRHRAPHGGRSRELRAWVRAAHQASLAKLTIGRGEGQRLQRSAFVLVVVGAIQQHNRCRAEEERHEALRRCRHSAAKGRGLRTMVRISARAALDTRPNWSEKGGAGPRQRPRSLKGEPNS